MSNESLLHFQSLSIEILEIFHRQILEGQVGARALIEVRLVGTRAGVFAKFSLLGYK
jgi:hypothetical protein